ncbi:hypothetical protein HK405_013671, partial [Cladochytrium tenue]
MPPLWLRIVSATAVAVLLLAVVCLDAASVDASVHSLQASASSALLSSGSMHLHRRVDATFHKRLQLQRRHGGGTGDATEDVAETSAAGGTTPAVVSDSGAPATDSAPATDNAVAAQKSTWSNSVVPALEYTGWTAGVMAHEGIKQHHPGLSNWAHAGIRVATGAVGLAAGSTVGTAIMDKSKRTFGGLKLR